MKTLSLAALGVCALLGCASLSAAPTVSVEGRVARAGDYPLGEHTRLFDVVGPAQVRADAFLMGAAWLHVPERSSQRRLKAGVLFDLLQVKREALLRDDEQLRELAERLYRDVSQLPVTGRRRHDLDPAVLEIERGANRPLATGDRIIYPPRPGMVRVVGAVVQECSLPFAGDRAVLDYLDDCPAHPAADRDWLYLIQPDGEISKLGVALWNRSPVRFPAPGAILLIPLPESRLHDLTDELNEDLAVFLATQPLPMDDSGR